MSYNRGKNSHKKKKSNYIVTEKGSLGLLALGDVGLDMWRNVRDGKNEKGLK